MDSSYARLALYVIPALGIAIAALAVALHRVRRLLALKDCRVRTHDLRRAVALLIHGVEEYSLELEEAIRTCGKACVAHREDLAQLRKDVDEAEALLREELEGLDGKGR